MRKPTWSGKVFTTKGPREENEDTAGVYSRGIIVCDGMGGHAQGAAASQMLVRKFKAGVPIEDFARDASSWLSSIDYEGGRSPGTTCSVACRHQGRLVGIHVGDSGLFLLPRDPARRLLRLTPSDSVGDMILKQDPEAVGGAQRFRSTLDRSVMAGERTRWHRCADLRHTPGDWIVGATDGLINGYDQPGRPELDEGRLEIDLRAVLAGELDGQEMVEHAAVTGRDNATLVFWRTPQEK